MEPEPSPAEPTAGAAAPLPRTVILLGLASLFTDVASESIFPLLPVFLTGTLGAGSAFLGFIEGAADATASLLKLASGYLAGSAVRRKRLVVFGYGLAGAVRPLVALATAPWHVLAVRVCDRIGKGTRTTPRDVMIANAAGPRAAGRAFGFHRAMDHAGAVAGPLLATALLAAGLGLRSVFAVAALPGLAAILCVLLVREPPPAPTSGGGATGAGAAPGASVGAARAPALPGSFRSYLAILLLFALGNSSDAFLLLRARDLGVGLAAIPVLWSLFHVSKLTSSWVFGAWSDRVSRTRLIAAGWVVYAGAYLGFALAREAWQVWALFVAYGTYYGLTEPVEKALVGQLVPVAARGRAFGLYNFTVGISALPAGLLMGWMWQRFGPATALRAGAALAAAAAALLVVWERRRSPVAMA